MGSGLVHASALEIAEAVQSRRVTAKEIAEDVLPRVHAAKEQLGAFLHISEESALQMARDVDHRLDRGEVLPLAGVPLAVKDNINVAGLPSTAGSQVLKGFVSPDHATCVSRLVEAGCVVVGKTNCDEFGMGSSNENSSYYPVKNPWNLNRVPGGSSGGSAAAVASRSVPLALGTDTGGSVRQPASFCGLVGVKPSYGRVSRYGLIAYASSLDQAGVLARSVREAAVAFSLMAGVDSRDSTSLATPVPDALTDLGAGVKGLCVGLLQEAASAEGGLHPEVKANLDETAEILARAGARVKVVSVPRVSAAVPVYYLTATAEASSNLARFDGVRYGNRQEEIDLKSLYRKTRSSGFGPEVKRRILLGTFALSAGYHDAYYGLAQKVRALLKADFEKAFADVDAILCPSSPEPAFLFGAKTADPLSMYLADVFTVPASLAGLPALSVPSGLSSDNVPLGVQFMGPVDSEPLLFRLAGAVERDSGFAGKKPACTIS